ncbi:MAG TPA: metallophosphoesterase [Desulfurivibrio alkaliphilus]|uniref:Metallophosphoesterase n=1 Tax=Desulfurivibrio alkaliphilus TaxID=427923 RepID=A0A7C2X970_9BACT|nr:metallophosphoesterase [Desulfurivibrio alkaliphilus]
MLLLLSAFLLIYGAMHCYFYWRLRGALPNLGAGRAMVGLFLLLMILAPVLVRLLEREGGAVAATLLAHLGFGWMGFLYLFTVVALMLDALRLLRIRLAGPPKLALPGVATSRWPARVPAPAAVFWLAFLAAVAGCAYGYREALDIRLEQVRIVSDKLPPAEGVVRIVQITDIHLGLIVRERRLERMLAVVAQARPDLLLATGDIVDGQGDGIAPLAEQFRRLKTPLGKFAILGNHEFYVGATASLDFHESAGFTVLRGELSRVTPWLTVAGVDDITGERLGLTPPGQEEELLALLPEETFNILLRHQPRVVPGGLVDLQLSGHIHRGQIFPFNLFTWLAYRVSTGLSVAADGRYLYVGRGTGTWGPPIRFLAPPEVTLIELIPAPAAS